MKTFIMFLEERSPDSEAKKLEEFSKYLTDFNITKQFNNEHPYIWIEPKDKEFDKLELAIKVYIIGGKLSFRIVRKYNSKYYTVGTPIGPSKLLEKQNDMDYLIDDDKSEKEIEEILYTKYAKDIMNYLHNIKLNNYSIFLDKEEKEDLEGKENLSNPDPKDKPYQTINI